LVWPKSDDKFFVVVDGCKTGVGYLLAVERDGKLKPVQYGGKALTKAQQNYDITNIEAYALVCAVREFRMWLINTQFTVYSDHYSLQWLKSKKGTSGRLLRWSIELSEYNYTVSYKDGKSNTCADSLSRYDYGPADENVKDEDEEKVIFSIDKDNDLFTDSAQWRQNAGQRKEKSKNVTVVNIEWDTATLDRQHKQTVVQPATTKSVELEYLTNHCYLSAVDEGNEESATISFQEYDLHKLQRECGDFADIIEYKETGNLPEVRDKTRGIVVQAEFFYLKDGILYHVQCIRNKRMNEYLPLISQICIPKCLREIIMRQVHDKSCHAGFEKAWSTARQKYWWKTLSNDLLIWVRNCTICGRVKPEYNKKKIPQTNIEVAGFMEAWSFDHVGPLPETDGPLKYKYILTATEHLSLYTEVWPVETCGAHETAEKIYELTCKWGVFKKAQFDRGSAFVSKTCAEMTRLLGIKRVYSSSAHPQTNGKLERWHSSLGVALRAYADQNNTSWNKLLPSIVHGFNTTAVTPSGFSPFQIVTGTLPRTLADCMISPKDDLPRDVESYVKEIEGRVQVIREIAKKNMEEAHERAKQQHDKRGTATPTYSAGDLVFLHRDHLAKKECAKLADKFKGPMLILHEGPNFSYKLKDMQTGKDLKYMVNASRLRPYNDNRDVFYSRNGVQCDPNSDDTVDENNTSAIQDTQTPGNNEHVPLANTTHARSYSHTCSSGLKISIFVGDILDTHAECVVNPANKKLRHGAGVALYLAKRAGTLMLRESREFIQHNGWLGLTECMKTSAGKIPMPTRYIIHSMGNTGGPRFGNHPQKLKF